LNTNIVDSDKEKKMRLIVGKINNLPTPPVVFQQISRVINDPNTSAYDIAKIISEDPALTVKILKLTNSSFYGIPRTVTNAKQAIVILGMEVVKSLVISASVFDMFSKKYKIDSSYLEQFWRHSLSVAFMARILCRQNKIPMLIEAEMLFSAGLLHDIGKLVIISEMSDQHKIILERTTADHNLSVFNAEEETLGFSHADIGFFLSNKWNLPEMLCQSIANHHNREQAESIKYNSLIHLANYLAHQVEIGNEALPPNLSPVYNNSWAIAGISRIQEPNLIEALREDFPKAETFLNMARGID
jgi:putative nucleotidyltransferase with HDIG domain